MKLKMFVVYDSKVKAYLMPFFMRTIGDALRAWETSVNDENSQFCRYPSDFTLFEIGEYDELTGVITQNEAKTSLGTALEFKKKPEASAPLLDLIGQKASM